MGPNRHCSETKVKIGQLEVERKLAIGFMNQNQKRQGQVSNDSGFYVFQMVIIDGMVANKCL